MVLECGYQSHDGSFGKKLASSGIELDSKELIYYHIFELKDFFLWLTSFSNFLLNESKSTKNSIDFLHFQNQFLTNFLKSLIFHCLNLQLQ